MNVSMSEKNDWSLNGCLWLGQDNSTKENNYKGYLSGMQSTDESIPNDFLKHMKKNRRLLKPNIIKHKRPKVWVSQPIQAHELWEDNSDIEKLEFEERQYNESCPEMTCELDNIEFTKKPRIST